MKEKKEQKDKELEFVESKLKSCITILKEKDKNFDSDKWFYFHMIPAIEGLRDYYRKKKLPKEAKQMTKYKRAFSLLLKMEKKNYAYLSIFLDDKTRVKSHRETGMGRLIEEKEDLKKWKKEKCRIVDGLNGMTSISFFGLNLELPTNKVEYLEQVKKSKDALDEGGESK